MKTVHLDLGPRSYDIRVGRDIVERIGSWLPRDGARRGFILADRALGAHTRRLERALKRAGWKTTTMPLRSGEGLKDLSSIYPIFGALLEQRANRHATIFALGGGVIGDAAGFVAATYLRGVPWVGVPTTLLAQVDSAIGGKTAVNHPAGKNLIGAFYQPALVVSELSYLDTLDVRDRVSGFGETIKYGIIADPAFFRRLARDPQAFLDLDPALLTAAVAKCSALKAALVEIDERDTLGPRETLNFGHTIGHALEAATDYKRFRHGEAIIHGMRAAAYISLERGHLPQRAFDEIDAALASLPVPPLPPALDDRAVLDAVLLDKKKTRAGKVRFVLLERLGKTVSDDGVGAAEIRAAVAFVRAHRWRSATARAAKTRVRGERKNAAGM
jgi:3-dehydroquinate synthase